MLKIDKKIIILFSGRLIQTAMAVLTIRLLTSLLSQQEVGHQYLINSIILWFSLVLINPVGMFVNRHLHEWKENKQLYYFIKQLNKYFMFIAVFSLPIVFLIRNYFNVGEFLPAAEILIFIFLYTYFSTWFQTLISLFNLFDLQKVFVLLNIFSQGCGLLFATLFVKLIEPSAVAWLSGLLMGQSLSLIIALYLFYKKFPKNKFNTIPVATEALFTKTTFNFCYPIAITTLFMWFMNQGYRLIVERNLGAEILASIGVGLGIATSLAGVVESITTQYFYPQYYATLSNSSLEQRSKAWKILWKRTIIVYVPCCFLIVSVSNLVVRALTAASFHHVVSFIWFGAVIELFRQLSNIAYLVSHGEKKTHNTILPYMIGGGFLAIVLMVLINKSILSIESILTSLVCAGLLTYVYNLIIVKKLISTQFEYNFLFKTLLWSVPLLIPLLFLSVKSNLMLLFSFGVFSGLWCLSIVYFLLKKEFNSFS